MIGAALDTGLTFDIRVVTLDDKPWFVLADVCRALGIQNPSMAAAALDDDERNTLSLTEGNRGNPNVTAVSEGGLYTVILRSREATTPGSVAHRFRKWVTGTVLPSIRKHGGGAPSTGPALVSPSPEKLSTD